MSVVSQEIKDKLNKYIDDDESYHVFFDKFLEDKLFELDKEWMNEMREIFVK